MKEALLYKKLDNSSVNCCLCAHGCLINEGKKGFCGVRQNSGGTLFSLNYGKLVAANLDPVEKKPLYHYLPGSSAFSIASFGCNFRCGFCQNWSISQMPASEARGAREFLPQDIVKMAKESGAQSIAYTYTEPTIYFEFAYETAKLAKKSGLGNIFVTNGYMSGEAVKLIGPYLDAANVDLKFFRETSYQKTCSARLAPVTEAIRSLHQAGVWVEVTTLVIPGQNDTSEELNEIAAFIAEVSREIPWHLSRFHPDYKFTQLPVTPEEALKTGYAAGLAQGLHYVYAGNLDSWGQDTLCPQCRKVLIKRHGFTVLERNLSAGSCRYCGRRLEGVF